MFNIYIENSVISILSDQETAPDNILLIKLNGLEKPHELATILQPFEEAKKTKSVVLLSPNPTQTLEAISSLYMIIEAAGGIVFNDAGKLLMIFRNDHWDLPKGKVEPGEEVSEAAIREVLEETGVAGLTINKKCSTTYHIYSLKKKRILKLTHWFQMHTSDRTILQPQLNEGITKAKWMNESELKIAANNCYASILHLLKEEKINC